MNNTWQKRALEAALAGWRQALEEPGVRLDTGRPYSPSHIKKRIRELERELRQQ